MQTSILTRAESAAWVLIGPVDPDLVSTSLPRLVATESGPNKGPEEGFQILISGSFSCVRVDVLSSSNAVQLVRPPMVYEVSSEGTKFRCSVVLYSIQVLRH